MGVHFGDALAANAFDKLLEADVRFDVGSKADLFFDRRSQSAIGRDLIQIRGEQPFVRITHKAETEKLT